MKKKKIYQIIKLSPAYMIYLIEGLRFVYTKPDGKFEHHFHGGSAGLLEPPGEDDIIGLYYTTRRDIEYNDLDFANDDGESQKVIFNPLYDSEGNHICFQNLELREIPFMLVDSHHNSFVDHQYKRHVYDAVTMNIIERGRGPYDLRQMLNGYYFQKMNDFYKIKDTIIEDD